MQQISFKIQYDAFFSDDELEELPGIKEFKEELSQEYISNVKGIGVGRGGAAYDLIIETLMSVTLYDFLKFLAEGYAFDVFKQGVKSFMLKPFLEAFDRFNAKNRNAVRIGSWGFKFEDTDVIITSANEKGVYPIIPKVFTVLVNSYSILNHPESKAKPDQINIPVIHDPKMENSFYGRFRELTEMEDFEMNYDDSIYFEYWGLQFNIRGQNLVYSVQNRKITDAEFCTAHVFETYVWKEINKTTDE